mmetsp:Transcript_54553/g.80038  ORF Transcript_54553/g.80038 Transcript_54553/m.80038 type:complete len:203 (+) Transcript_54553:126-734(+)
MLLFPKSTSANFRGSPGKAHWRQGLLSASSCAMCFAPVLPISFLFRHNSRSVRLCLIASHRRKVSSTPMPLLLRSRRTVGIPKPDNITSIRVVRAQLPERMPLPDTPRAIRSSMVRVCLHWQSIAVSACDVTSAWPMSISLVRHLMLPASATCACSTWALFDMHVPSTFWKEVSSKLTYPNSPGGVRVSSSRSRSRVCRVES